MLFYVDGAQVSTCTDFSKTYDRTTLRWATLVVMISDRDINFTSDHKEINYRPQRHNSHFYSYDIK